VHPNIQHVLKTFGPLLAVLVLGLALAVCPMRPWQPRREPRPRALVRTQRQAKVRPSRAAGPVAKVSGKRTLRRVAVKAAPPVPSFGELSGLRATDDELDLKSSVALVSTRTPTKSCSARIPFGRAADRIDHQADDGAGRDRAHCRWTSH
jgi:hypothetical protein